MGRIYYKQPLVDNKSEIEMRINKKNNNTFNKIMENVMHVMRPHDEAMKNKQKPRVQIEKRIHGKLDLHVIDEFNTFSHQTVKQ